MSDDRPAILVVDDELQVVESLRRTLRHENYEIITHTSPLEALRVLESRQVDVLLSDIDMPEMTGLELIATARKRWPDVARILLTGDSSLDSALAAINDGAVHKYLTKPWRAKELRECLRDMIAGLAAVRMEVQRNQVAERAKDLLDELEHEFPGFSFVGREDGAYLLNDMRATERLRSMGEAVSSFRARTWRPNAFDPTEDLRKP